MSWNLHTFDDQVSYAEIKKDLIDVVMERNPRVWPVVPPASFVTNGRVRYMLMGMDDDDLVYIRDDKCECDEGWDADANESATGPLMLSYLYPDRPRQGADVLAMWWIRDNIYWPNFFMDSWQGAGVESSLSSSRREES